ncbi:hypothetical protein BDV41DRAFT_578474 [Aspergillus transmontanensis]|uniref:Uncharacterized protein n=1 Tax=Aspergillus transmontanensis TaxID=1034304 RepID=A0A5N6VSW0_9EURO|nr:hypothetical protein BDV41DRAFT_578474 [Aspergillus transmontanensis]
MPQLGYLLAHCGRLEVPPLERQYLQDTSRAIEAETASEMRVLQSQGSDPAPAPEDRAVSPPGGDWVSSASSDAGLIATLEHFASALTKLQQTVDQLFLAMATIQDGVDSFHHELARIHDTVQDPFVDAKGPPAKRPRSSKTSRSEIRAAREQIITAESECNVAVRGQTFPGRDMVAAPINAALWNEVDVDARPLPLIIGAIKHQAEVLPLINPTVSDQMLVASAFLYFGNLDFDNVCGELKGTAPVTKMGRSTLPLCALFCPKQPRISTENGFLTTSILRGEAEIAVRLARVIMQYYQDVLIISLYKAQVALTSLKWENGKQHTRAQRRSHAPRLLTPDLVVQCLTSTVVQLSISAPIDQPSITSAPSGNS